MNARRVGDFLPAAVFAALGAALLGLAIPRTIAAWISLGAEPTMTRLETNRPTNVQQLGTCVAAYDGALRWKSSSVRFANLGTCEFSLALAAPTDTPQRAEWLARAEEHTKTALLLNPAESFAWARLAFIRASRGASARDVVAPLIVSLDTGPNIRALWRSRTRLMLRYAPFMTVDELLTVRHQLKTIWIYGPSERPHLLEMAHTLDRMPQLLWALRDEPEAMTELETMERNTRFP